MDRREPAARQVRQPVRGHGRQRRRRKRVRARARGVDENPPGAEFGVTLPFQAEGPEILKDVVDAGRGPREAEPVKKRAQMGAIRREPAFPDSIAMWVIRAGVRSAANGRACTWLVSAPRNG